MADGGEKTFYITKVFISDASIPSQTQYDIRYHSVSNSYGVRYTDDEISQVFSGVSDSNWKQFSDPLFTFDSIWTPQKTLQVQNTERIKEIKLGDGYRKQQAEGLNSQESRYSASFEFVTNQEAKQLIAFSEYKGACGTFFWQIPNPYNKKKMFRLLECKHTWEGYNSNNISIVFEEVFSTQNF